MKYWLMKTEPLTFSIDHLKKLGKTPWEGVRNYQARNYMRDGMKVGDLALFYHSNAAAIGVAGVGRVCKSAYPDFTALDPKSKYYDPKSTPENPRWMMVDLEFVEKFPKLITLEELKLLPELKTMLVIKRGMRLSVQPVEKKHFEVVRRMGV